MTKLSIIVPIYGVEQYLRKCVDSLLNQDIPSSEYEIILVDDGGHDKCPLICDSYAAKCENVRVVHRKNGGLSAARNSGIEVAHGDYVMFVDSDDYIEPNVLGKLMEQVERGDLDVLRYNYQNVRLVNSERNLEYEVFEPFKAAKRDVDYSESVTDGETFLNERLGPGCYAWQFIIKRSLIINELESERVRELGNSIEDRRFLSPQENDLKVWKIEDCLFKEGIYFEDTEWTPRMLLQAERVESTPMVVYNYLWRVGSITLPTDPKKRDKVICDKISLIRGFQEQSKSVKNTAWYEWMTSFIAMTILNSLTEIQTSDRKRYIKELQSMNIFPLSTIRERGISKLQILLTNISPMAYCYIMRLRKAVK